MVEHFIVGVVLGVIVTAAVQCARSLRRIADAHEEQAATLKIVLAAVIDPRLVRVTHPPSQVPDYPPENL